MPAIGGSTIRNIAAAHHIEIEPPQTGLVARRAVILSPTGRLAPGNRLAGRAEIWAATALEGAARAIVPAAPALATTRAEAERIASEAGISRAAVVETGMPSEVAREDTADRTLVPAAAGAPPAWDLEAEASVAVVVAVGGAGRNPDSGTKFLGAQG